MERTDVRCYEAHGGGPGGKSLPFKLGLFNFRRFVHTPVLMAAASYHRIKDSLRQLYLDDPRPWLVGFSGGKDSTLVAALVFDTVLSIPPAQRTKPVTVLCTDTRQKGIIMSDWKETNRLRELQEEVAAEKGIRADTLRRLLAKVDEFSESHRAFGLPDDLLNILKDGLAENGELVFN